MTMDQAAFQALLDTHGADPARWPERERTAATALAAHSPEAAAALATARRLDAMLVGGLATEAGASLRNRITAGATRAPERTPVRTSSEPGWLAAVLAPWRLGTATAAAASIALGMMVGLEASIATVLDPEITETMDLAALAYGHVDGLEDIQ
ncbi:MAG: hypothetical protein ACFCVH_16520 [Alphaproteobacteria bacterium]